jgi:ferredoxin
MTFMVSLPYLKCKERYDMAHKISDACTNCGTCDSECPTEAIAEKDGKRAIDAEKCVDCGACIGACPVEAIAGE